MHAEQKVAVPAQAVHLVSHNVQRPDALLLKYPVGQVE